MNDKLKDWRKQIDDIDEDILAFLAERMKIVGEIGKFKRLHSIALLDEKRWQKVLESKLSKANGLNLSEKFVQKLYDLIHQHSLEIEKNSKL